MPLFKFRVSNCTNCFQWKADVDNNDHVFDVDWGFWRFRYFKKAPDREYH